MARSRGGQSLHQLTPVENSTVAVFGIGCVGLSILQGARAKKCARVFAIDTNPKKEEWAKKFGASECCLSHNMPPLRLLSTGQASVSRECTEC